MEYRPLLLYAIILIGSGSALDVPFVFGGVSKDPAELTSTQLEQESATSLYLAGVPSVDSPSTGTAALPTIPGGSLSPEETRTEEDDLMRIVSARVQPNNPAVHEVALQMVAKFPGDLTIDQICSIYGYMKDGQEPVKGWSYVRDPAESQYYRYANQSLEIGELSGCVGVGDCNDFAIVMSSLVESIGGTTRTILSLNRTLGEHAYAEVYLGSLSDKNSQVDEIIDWLKQKFHTNKIYTHIDTDTRDVWLNLDWGADDKRNAHPGGPYFRGYRHIAVYDRTTRKTSLKLPSATEERSEPGPAYSLNITANEIAGKRKEVCFNKGYALNSLGKYDEAIKAYDEAIRLDPDYAMAWNNKGIAFYSQGRYNSAIKAYDECIRLDPSYITAWNNKGWTLYKQGKYGDAVNCLDKATELDPNYALAWNNKGNVFFDQGKYEKAIKAFDTAIKLNPEFAWSWNNKGTALNNLGEYDDAINCFDEALRIDPDYSHAWFGKGYALFAKGRYEKAVDCFDRAVRMDPEDADAWYNKGSALGQLGRYDEAIDAFDEAIRLNPNSDDARQGKNLAFNMIGRTI
jgi:tetratricopeptide (TPR) repeat protein